jgi:RNA polymerase sigma factor (TIGR02999 family)
MNTAEGDVTQLLAELGAGDDRAADRLLPLVYHELRALAQRNLTHERADHTLQATALVHEAYLRLVDSDRIHLRNRAHFFALAAQALRRILIDHARSHNRKKRGGANGKLSLQVIPELFVQTDVDVLALDEALAGLKNVGERYAQIVEMRFFGGMTMEEIAELLGVSIGTVERDWRTARAWLYRQLADDETKQEPDTDAR